MYVRRPQNVEKREYLLVNSGFHTVPRVHQKIGQPRFPRAITKVKFTF